MVRIGYTLSSEEHAPGDLLLYGRIAEESGFDFLTISDHFHPWTSRQGQSPFVWSVLGGLAVKTEEIPVMTAVTCPTMRIHPAIVAQAAATTASLLPDRFTLGVGTGENLNEHVTGTAWPDSGERLDMLEEAIGLIRRLWTGRPGHRANTALHGRPGPPVHGARDLASGRRRRFLAGRGQARGTSRGCLDLDRPGSGDRGGVPGSRR